MSDEITNADLEDIRRRLEAVAEEFGASYAWDEARLHLTLSDPRGEPIATLHVELVQ